MALRQAEDWLLGLHPSLFSQFYGKIPEPEIQEIIPINTDISIGSSWSSVIAKNFSISTSGIITFTGSSAIFMFAPSIQFTSNRSCNLLFSVKLNGVEISSTVFNVTSSTADISRFVSRLILISLSPLDTLQCYVSTDTANTILTWQQASIVLKG